MGSERMQLLETKTVNKQRKELICAKCGALLNVGEPLTQESYNDGSVLRFCLDKNCKQDNYSFFRVVVVAVVIASFTAFMVVNNYVQL